MEDSEGVQEEKDGHGLTEGYTNQHDKGKFNIIALGPKGGVRAPGAGLQQEPTSENKHETSSTNNFRRPVYGRHLKHRNARPHHRILSKKKTLDLPSWPGKSAGKRAGRDVKLQRLML